MRYASRTKRLIGQFLDGLVVALIVVVASVAAGVIGATSGDPMANPVMIVGILFALGYHFLSDALSGGQSLGKRALGIAVEHAETGRPCSAGQSFVRNVLLAVLGPIDWIFIFGAKHQRLGDVAAGTVVVEK